jgi:hypothetical protein
MPDKTPELSSQPILSPETLQDGPWFESVRLAYEVRTKPSHPPRWLVPLIGFFIAGLLWLIGWKTAAIVAASIITVLTVIELVNPLLGEKIQKAFALFGTWLAYALGWVLLAPLFMVVGPLSKLFTRVMGADPLGRRLAGAPTYWHFSAGERQRTRKTGSMFCVERRPAGGRNWLAALALLGVIGFIAGELVLRYWFGFHSPLLYSGDADCGYRPRPGQTLQTGRGRVTINNFSMRCPSDVEAKKPDGVFRIFLIGDSTLFGGEYLTDEETYALLLERKLNGEHGGGGRRVEVLPMGVNGWGPLHALGYVNRFGTFEADLGIIAMSAANCDRPLTLMDGTRFPAVKPRLAWEVVFSKIAWEQNRKIATGGTGNYFPAAAESLRLIKRGEDAFVALGAAMLLTTPEVMQQAIPQITYGMNALAGTIETPPGGAPGALPYIERLTPRMLAIGIVMDYPAKLFVGQGTRKELFHDDAHLEVKGHRLFAMYLADRIVRNSKRFRTWAGLPAPATETASPSK